MAGTASAIRAGSAFVELLIRDETVQRSLDNVKARLQTFGESVQAVGSQGFTPMAATATTSVVAAGASVGVLAATMGVLRSTVLAVGTAFRVAFAIITGGVLRVVAALSVMLALVSRFASGGVLSKLLSGFLSRSQTTELIGRWTRFIGILAGSSELRGFGNRIWRLGLGASIVSGFRSGVMPGIGAALGAGFRSVKSIISTAILEAVLAPLRLAKGAVSAVFRGIPITRGPAPMVGLPGAFGGGGRAAAAATMTGRAISGTATAVSALSASLRAVLLRVGGFAAALSGPALLAAKKFVATSQEIVAASKKVGEGYQSIEDGIAARYGAGSMISRNDILAANALGESMTTLKKAMAAVWAQIGAAALPILKAMTERMITIAQSITAVIAKNRELITTIVRVASIVGAASGALLALQTAFPVIAAAIGFVLSPLGLFAGAIAAAVMLFPMLRTAAQSALSAISARFALLGEIFGETMGGISDALQGGSLEAAGRVAWAGLKLAWLEGTNELRSIWRGFQTWIAGAFLSIGSAIEKAMVDAFYGIQSAWSGLQNGLAGGIARIIALATGQNVQDVLDTLTEDQQREEKGRAAEYAKRQKQIAKDAADAQKTLDEDAARREQAAADALAAARQEFAEAREAARKLKPVAPGAGPDMRSLAASFVSMGSFSAAGLGRQRVAGLGVIEDATRETAENTAEIARNTRNMGVEFA